MKAWAPSYLPISARGPWPGCAVWKNNSPPPLRGDPTGDEEGALSFIRPEALTVRQTSLKHCHWACSSGALRDLRAHSLAQCPLPLSGEKSAVSLTQVMQASILSLSVVQHTPETPCSPISPSVKWGNNKNNCNVLNAENLLSTDFVSLKIHRILRYKYLRFTCR